MKGLFLQKLIYIINIMRKLAVVFFVAFITVLVVGSCNQKPCPAYSKADIEQAGTNA